MHDSTMQLVPGKALGEFHLGDSLWHVLETMRASKVRYGGTSVRWDREDPCSPVIVDVPHGIRLVFPYTSCPHQQLLQIITIQLDGDHAFQPGHEETDSPSVPSKKRTHPGSLAISYNDQHLVTISSAAGGRQPLTRSKLIHSFGPALSRRPGTPSSSFSSSTTAKPLPPPSSSSNRSSPVHTSRGGEPEIRYPGVIFHLQSTKEGVDVVSGITVVPPGREVSGISEKMLEQLEGRMRGEGRAGARGAVEVDDQMGREGTISLCEIRPKRGVLLHIITNHCGPPPTRVPYEVTLYQTTAQDLLCDLGPPTRRFWKEDDRLAVKDLGTSSRSGGDQRGQQRDASRGCWWNYFHLGLDFLVEEQGQGRVTKIMVHSNIPGTAQFHTHARCPWSIEIPAPSSSDSKHLSFGNTLEDFAAHFDGSSGGKERPAATSMKSSAGAAGDGKSMNTVMLDRLDDTYMAGLQEIEPSRLLALDGMVLEEAGGGGVTSVLLY